MSHGRLGIDHASLHEVNDRLLYLSLSSYGQSGPEADATSFGSSLDLMSGLASVTGYGDGPHWSSNQVNYPDQVVALLGAGMIVYCLQQGIRGAHLDIAQVETMTWTLAPYIADYLDSGHVAGVSGNARPDRAPCDTYPVAEPDEWVAISCASDDHRRALHEVAGCRAEEFSLGWWTEHRDVDRPRDRRLDVGPSTRRMHPTIARGRNPERPRPQRRDPGRTGPLHHAQGCAHHADPAEGTPLRPRVLHSRSANADTAPRRRHPPDHAGGANDSRCARGVRQRPLRVRHRTRQRTNPAGFRSAGATADVPNRRNSMSRRRIQFLSVVAVVAVVATACSSPGASSSSPNGSGATSAAGKKFSVAYMVAGTLGDLSFHDGAKSGVDMAASQLGATTKVIEGGVNATQTWQSDLQALASSHQWDLVMSDTSFVTDQMTAVAKQNPDQKFLMLDQQIDAPNIASVIYRQNDGAFLAGVLAALVTTDKADFPLASGSKNVGIIGGLNIPVINDFVVGFKKGVEVVDPSIKVQTSYVGNFVDAQAGYNQAAAMYAAGADVVFAAAGGAGLGVLKASADKNRYSIGVDSNQNSLQPKNVLASDLKNVGKSVLEIAAAVPERHAADGSYLRVRHSEWGRPAAAEHGSRTAGRGREDQRLLEQGGQRRDRGSVRAGLLRGDHALIGGCRND